MNAHDGEPSLALLRIVVEVCRSDVYLVGQFRVSLGRVAVQATRALAEHQPHSVKLKLQINNSIFFLIWDVFFLNSHFWSVGINIFRSLSTSHILSSWNFKSITREKKFNTNVVFLNPHFWSVEINFSQNIPLAKWSYHLYPRGGSDANTWLVTPEPILDTEL